MLWEENMQGGILGPITHMFVTSDLFTLVHYLNVQAATVTSHQKQFIEEFFLSLSPKVGLSFHTHCPSAFKCMFTNRSMIK